MNILVDIGHPAHVHLYKNFIIQAKINGHKVIVTVKDIPIAKQLLKACNIEFIDLGSKKNGLAGKMLNQLVFDYKI
jgi:predicted glycosyltransferase